MIQNRQLPHDFQGEQKVLGFCFSNNDYFDELRPEHFYNEIHRNMYNAIIAGEFQVTEVVSKKHNFEITQYFDVVESYAPSTEIKLMVDKIIEYWARRQMILDLNKKEIDLYDVNSDISDDLGQYTVNNSQLMSGSILKESVLESWKGFSTITHRFTHLVNKMPSFEPSEVFLLAGRSGTGKTALGIQLCDAIAEGMNEKWMFFSMEMSAKLVMKRFAMIYYWEQYKWDGTIEESNKWFMENCKKRNFMDTFFPHNMILCDQSGLTVDGIRKRLKIAKKEHPNLKTILIDYLQLIKGKGGNRREEASEIARSLRPIAKEFDVRLVGLCQTSREGEDGYKPVQLNHLKESGDWEEVSDIVMGMWKKKDIDDLVASGILKDRNNGGLGMCSFKKYGLYFSSPNDADIANWTEKIKISKEE
jgi:replicative DNA helicase